METMKVWFFFESEGDNILTNSDYEVSFLAIIKEKSSLPCVWPADCHWTLISLVIYRPITLLAVNFPDLGDLNQGSSPALESLGLR